MNFMKYNLDFEQGIDFQIDKTICRKGSPYNRDFTEFSTMVGSLKRDILNTMEEAPKSGVEFLKYCFCFFRNVEQADSIANLCRDDKDISQTDLDNIKKLTVSLHATQKHVIDALVKGKKIPEIDVVNCVENILLFSATVAGNNSFIDDRVVMDYFKSNKEHIKEEFNAVFKKYGFQYDFKKRDIQYFDYPLAYDMKRKKYHYGNQYYSWAKKGFNKVFLKPEGWDELEILDLKTKEIKSEKYYKEDKKEARKNKVKKIIVAIKELTKD